MVSLCSLINFRWTLTIFVIIITMARLDWFMMLLVLVMTFFINACDSFPIAGKSYQLYRNQTKWRGKQTQLIEESLTPGSSGTNSKCSRPDGSPNFNEVNGKYANYSQGAIFYSSVVNPATRFFNSLLLRSHYRCWCLSHHVGGTFTVGQLTTFLNYVTQYTKTF